VAVGERTALALSLALTRWRHACDLQASGQQARSAEANAARTARAQVEEGRRRIAELEAELLSAAAADRAAAAAPRPKEKALARMLRDQQEELRDAYGFSARCKLRVTIEQRAALALSGSFSRWRQACELHGADLQLRRAREHRAEGLAAGSEASALRSRVAELEGRLTAAVSSAKASSAQAGALGRRVAELEQELTAASATTPRAKVEKMTRMLRDQQEELRDAYRFSAGCKLQTVIERHAAMKLSGTFAHWRRECELADAAATRQLQLGNLETECRRD